MIDIISQDREILGHFLWIGRCSFLSVFRHDYGVLNVVKLVLNLIHHSHRLALCNVGVL